MPDHYFFKCKTCNAELVGPEVSPKNKPALNTEFAAGKVPNLRCAKGPWHMAFIYIGNRFVPPKAPPLPQATTPALPAVWVPDEQGGYQRQNRYPHIPDVAQAALIAQLEPLLSDPDNRVWLLGASTDRFSDYADVEDMPIDLDAEGEAEQWLTVPLVLDRLDRVAKALGNIGLWKIVQIDRQLGGRSAALTLPANVDGFRFHQELLNDLVNPRGGHAVAPATFAAAVKQAIALRKANDAGEDRRGSTRGYYFFSTGSNRGVNVVTQGADQIMTVYYSSAASAWFAGALDAQVRAARTVA